MSESLQGIEARRHRRAMLAHRALDDAKITRCDSCDGWGWLGRCRTCGAYTPPVEKAAS